jgi:hypothetical protein
MPRPILDESHIHLAIKTKVAGHQQTARVASASKN